MRRIFIAAATTVGMLATIGLPTAAAARGHHHHHHSHHFTRTLLGAAVSPNENVYDVRGPGGHNRGAVVQFIDSTFPPPPYTEGGTATDKFFDGKGTIVSKDGFTLSMPDANGIIHVTGTGRSVRGTGIYRHVQETYSFSGTINTNTGQYNLNLSGFIAL